MQESTLYTSPLMCLPRPGQSVTSHEKVTRATCMTPRTQHHGDVVLGDHDQGPRVPRDPRPQPRGRAPAGPGVAQPVVVGLPLLQRAVHEHQHLHLLFVCRSHYLLHDATHDIARMSNLSHLGFRLVLLSSCGLFPGKVL